MKNLTKALVKGALLFATALFSLIAFSEPNPYAGMAPSVQKAAKMRLDKLIEDPAYSQSRCILKVSFAGDRVTTSDERLVLPGDTVQKVNGRNLDSSAQAPVVDQLEQIAPNTTVSLQIIRHGATQEVTLRCGDSKPRFDRVIEAYFAAAHFDFKGCVKKFNEAAQYTALNADYLWTQLDCRKLSEPITQYAANTQFYNIQLMRIRARQFSAQQLASIRGQMLSAVESLRNSGAGSLADDLKKQLDEAVLAANRGD